MHDSPIKTNSRHQNDRVLAVKHMATHTHTRVAFHKCMFSKQQRKPWRGAACQYAVKSALRLYHVSQWNQVSNWLMGCANHCPSARLDGTEAPVSCRARPVLSGGPRPHLSHVSPTSYDRRAPDSLCRRRRRRVHCSCVVAKPSPAFAVNFTHKQHTVARWMTQLNTMK